jgi:glutaminyl-tRNA synthetase
VYIERTDFRVKDEKGYYGLAPGKQVLLKYAHNITCTDVVYDDKGEVVELKATLERGSTVKVKGKLKS